MSTPSPGCRISLLTEEEMEPYVRKKRASSEIRNKMLGLNEHEQNLLRNAINSRERKRMHNLNEALEELRSCLPYGREANSRKLSKISTILLASNWIRQLVKENARLLTEIDPHRRQIGSAHKSDVTSVVPTLTPPSIQMTQPTSLPIFPFPCLKAFGQPCFCVGCITAAVTKKS